jgi:cyanophycinase
MTRRKPAASRPGAGHLYIIGGGEDRKNSKVVLSRFMEVAGGEDARVVVLTAASTEPDAMWAIYDEAFGALGMKHRSTFTVESRDEANDEARAAAVFEADAVFMTGGDQKRLLALIGGTRIDKAMHMALRERGTCIAGTSAGASAMSEHMLYDGSAEPLAAKGLVHLAAGLGFIRRAVIDQHFSERHRLGRLLSIVAQNPYLLGAGIDEDTALLIAPGAGLEVVGTGAVTMLDGREMLSNYLAVDERERLELTNVKLHLLPGGARYYFVDPPGADADGPQRGMPDALRDVIAALTSAPQPPAVHAGTREAS